MSAASACHCVSSPPLCISASRLHALLSAAATPARSQPSTRRALGIPSFSAPGPLSRCCAAPLRPHCCPLSVKWRGEHRVSPTTLYSASLPLSSLAVHVLHLAISCIRCCTMISQHRASTPLPKTTLAVGSRTRQPARYLFVAPAHCQLPVVSRVTTHHPPVARSCTPLCLSAASHPQPTRVPSVYCLSSNCTSCEDNVSRVAMTRPAGAESTSPHRIQVTN